MEFTGERVVPGKVEPDLMNEHLSRYAFANNFAAGRQVLDLGCGTGYGAAILAQVAQSVLAIDISEEAIGYARHHYFQSGIQFVAALGSCLPVRSASLDLVICFEVVEHVSEQSSLLEEISRVLSPNGILLISTPNRRYYTEERQEVNPFHTKEFDYEEFSAFLKQRFEEVEICFQNHVPAIFLGSGKSPAAVSIQLPEANPDLKAHSNFFLAVCAKKSGTIPPYKELLYVPSTANLLREKERWIGALEARLKELDQAVLKLRAENDELYKRIDERSDWARRLELELKDFQNQTNLLQQELLERTAWAQQLNEELQQKDERISLLQKEFDERTAWALRLNQELDLCQAKLERVRQSRLYRLSKAFGLVPKI
ncbi:MAG: methyltransferase domain-containing protein [Terriglobia bacterium]